MAVQFGRPDSDLTTTGIAGGTFAAIDEASASDVDFVYGAEATAVTYIVSLSNVTDPNVHTGHTFRYRIAKLNGTTVDTGGNDVFCTVTLLQGATTIKADAQKTAAGWTSYDLTLSEAEAANITDYTDLRLQFVSPSSEGGAVPRRAIGISWAELEVAEVVAASIDLVIQDSGHGHSVDSLTLTQHNALAVADSAHSHTADSPALTQHHVLVIQDSLHEHASDGATLSTGVELVIQDSAHGHAADGLALIQHNIIVIQESTHGHTADGLALTQHQVLVIADTWHAHYADGISVDTGLLKCGAHVCIMTWFALTIPHRSRRRRR